MKSLEKILKSLPTLSYKEEIKNSFKYEKDIDLLEHYRHYSLNTNSGFGSFMSNLKMKHEHLPITLFYKINDDIFSIVIKNAGGGYDVKMKEINKKQLIIILSNKNNYNSYGDFII